MNEFDSQFVALVQSDVQNRMDKAYAFFKEHYEKRIKIYAANSKVAPPTEANTVVVEVFMELVEAIKSNVLKTPCDAYIWERVPKQVEAIHRAHKKNSLVDYFGEFPYAEPYQLHEETSRTSLDLWDERYKAILESLSPKDYQLLQAYLNDTTKKKAIADALGEKEGTIRKRWHLLKSKLRNLLSS
jgi:RNA polymerase sigma factor (sigma-70 family)